MVLKSDSRPGPRLAPNGEPWIDKETLRDVRIIFRNLSGAETQYNRKGDRNFGLLLPDRETADRLASAGWNVKQLKPRINDEGEEQEGSFWIEVSAKYGDTRPPKVVLVTSYNRTPLNEDTVGMIDAAVIMKVDITIRPYQWAMNGKVGTKAYLQTMYVTIQEDELDRDYADTPARDDEPVDEWSR